MKDLPKNKEHTTLSNKLTLCNLCVLCKVLHYREREDASARACVSEKEIFHLYELIHVLLVFPFASVVAVEKKKKRKSYGRLEIPTEEQMATNQKNDLSWPFRVPCLPRENVERWVGEQVL